MVTQLGFEPEIKALTAGWCLQAERYRQKKLWLPRNRVFKLSLRPQRIDYNRTRLGHLFEKVTSRRPVTMASLLEG